MRARHVESTQWTKSCNGCKTEYSAPTFEMLTKYYYRDASRPDGLCVRCKECFRHKKQLPSAVLRRVIRYRDKNPEKVNAWAMVKRALNTGEIVKSKQCDVCGQSGRIEGHHSDYKKPLSVMWLCKKCHVKKHLEEKP